MLSDRAYWELLFARWPSQLWTVAGNLPYVCALALFVHLPCVCTCILACVCTCIVACVCTCIVACLCTCIVACVCTCHASALSFCVHFTCVYTYQSAKCVHLLSICTCLMCALALCVKVKGKVFYGQEPPSRESTTTECGVNYQLLAVITELAQWGNPSCSRPQPATDNAIRDCRSN